jgi:uncharacterized membrane protein
MDMSWHLKAGAALMVGLTFLWLRPALASSEPYVRNAATDIQGKPIRGALVKATLGIKIVSRFMQADGRSEISVAPGKYDAAAEAYGFDSAKQTSNTAQSWEIDFRLSRRLEVSRLNAEIDNFMSSSAVSSSPRLLSFF